jgi:hypothetical protein
LLLSPCTQAFHTPSDILGVLIRQSRHPKLKDNFFIQQDTISYFRLKTRHSKNDQMRYELSGSQSSE